VRTHDIVSTPRAPLLALHEALAGNGASIIIASECTRARPASGSELREGDGAAALMVGSEDLLAECLGSASITANFVDLFRQQDRPFSYEWEERWVREAGYLDLVPRAIEAALRDADIGARNVDIAILPDTQVRLAQAIGKASGLRAETLAPTPHLQTGDLGSADSFFRLVLALETAAPEKIILVAGFGQGATALVFRKTAKPSPNSAALALAGGIEDANYSKLLFSGPIKLARKKKRKIKEKKPEGKKRKK
jgi:3-hydroxy-3-methylglutaryl CoA synthase